MPSDPIDRSELFEHTAIVSKRAVAPANNSQHTRSGAAIFPSQAFPSKYLYGTPGLFFKADFDAKMYRNTLVLSICPILVFILSACQTALAASRTSPPYGALVVRNGTQSTSGEFKSIMAAINSLLNDSSSRSIFIYPGTYNEQINITRIGPLTVSCYHGAPHIVLILRRSMDIRRTQ